MGENYLTYNVTYVVTVTYVVSVTYVVNVIYVVTVTFVVTGNWLATGDVATVEKIIKRIMCMRRSVRYVRTVRKCIEWRNYLTFRELE